MSAGTSLRGRRIAVTRAKEGEDALTERLRDLGAEVLPFPSIATSVPASYQDLDAALRELGRFDWIAFASGNAVDALAARLTALHLHAPPQRVKLAAVGQTTAARLAGALRAPDLVPVEASGEALAAAMAPLVRGKRVLVPRAAEGRPELVAGLTAAGAEVVAVEAYRTVSARPETLRILGDLLGRGEVDAVAFASPSAVRSVVTALGERAPLLGRAALAAIGPTTAEAIRAAGLRVDVQPSEYTAVALADAIAARLGPRT
jgi:uroporphyrinogen-III synthase